MPTGATPQERDPEEVARLTPDFLPRREFGAFNKFYDNTLTGNTASVTIPIPTWVNSLYFEFLLRSDEAVINANANLRPNNDGGANYDYGLYGVDAGAAIVFGAGGVTGFLLKHAGTGSASARMFDVNRGWLSNCQSTVTDKEIVYFTSDRTAGAYGNNISLHTRGGFWRPNPAVAITSLVISPVTAAKNFVASCSLKCWGI